MKKAIATSSSPDDRIGAIFTPEEWATYAARWSGVLDAWLAGASVCDPTAGDGAFVFALCDQAMCKGRGLFVDLVRRIFVCEKDREFHQRFLATFEARYGLAFPRENAHLGDILKNPPDIQVDWLIGNPPWVNFCDLPDPYKETLKPYFLATGLADGARSLLLGGARIDLAALIVVWSISRFLRPHGKAAFFLPLSLFQNHGAHNVFRRYALVGGRSYALREIIDLEGEDVFAGASTRFGIARFERDAVTTYPVPYNVYNGGSLLEKQATPVPNAQSPLLVHAPGDDPLASISDAVIRLNPDQMPRQGVNTCGANEAFIFDAVPDFLPSSLMYPLTTKECFRSPDEHRAPGRHVFLPYDPSSGRPLSQRVLEREFPGAWEYLLKSRERLLGRKGALIQSWCKRGYWWALLGVGPYCFAPYKVMWEAYGARDLTPIILGSHGQLSWQGNQAMHAYIPCSCRNEAAAIQAQLRRPSVQRFLESSRTGGTCNWAQPGRMKQIIQLNEEVQLPLF